MLELDISCHATSLSLFSHWMFLEVVIFFMLSQIFSMSRNKENRRSHDFHFTEVIICFWIVNVDTQLIFCGTSIFSYQWNSRCTLPLKTLYLCFFFPIFLQINTIVRLPCFHSTKFSLPKAGEYNHKLSKIVLVEFVKIEEHIYFHSNLLQGC